MEFVKYPKIVAILFLLCLGCVLLVCLVFLGNLIYGNHPLSHAKASRGIVCDQTVYDFGHITKTQANLCQYKLTLTNTSSHPIRILKQVSSCACTVANVPKEAIPPKKSIDVLVKAKFGPRAGIHQETILFKTDDFQTPTVLLTLRAFVDIPAMIEPKLIDFGTMKLGKQKTRIVTISAVTNQEFFNVLKITNSSPYVNITRLQPDESTDKILLPQGGSGKFAVTITSPNVPGNERTTVTFHTNSNEAKELKLIILAQFQGSIQAVPSIVVFPPTKSLDNEIRNIQITFTEGNIEPRFELLSRSTGLSPFDIIQIESVSGTVQMTKIVKIVLQRDQLQSGISRSVLKVIAGSELLEIPIVALKR